MDTKNKHLKMFVQISVWLILTLLVLDFSFTLINTASTMSAILGTAILIVWIVITVNTNCFTAASFKSKLFKHKQK